MRTIYTIAFLVFSSWLSTVQADCPAPEWYTLYCRGGGGFSVQNMGLGTPSYSTTEVLGKFKKNPYPYYPSGGFAIKPGFCTWYDRILNSSEPSEFQFSVFTNVMSSQVGLNLFTQCAPNSNCWLVVCAHSVEGSPLRALPDNISIFFGSPP